MRSTGDPQKSSYSAWIRVEHIQPCLIWKWCNVPKKELNQDFYWVRLDWIEQYHGTFHEMNQIQNCNDVIMAKFPSRSTQLSRTYRSSFPLSVDCSTLYTYMCWEKQHEWNYQYKISCRNLDWISARLWIGIEISELK